MQESNQTYCIDTSSLIHAYRRSYPPDVLPGLWDTRFDELIQSGKLISPYDVLEELKKKDDELFGWAKSYPNLFSEIDVCQDELTEVMARFPKLVDTKKGRSGADPVVIALAKSRVSNIVVVTEEGFGSTKNPKIPFVCNELRIKCINVLQLLRDQGWTF